jgi:hypothetical protein
MLIENDRVSAGRRQLKAIIEKNPDTDAAAKAEKQLEALPDNQCCAFDDCHDRPDEKPRLMKNALLRHHAESGQQNGHERSRAAVKDRRTRGN